MYSKFIKRVHEVMQKANEMYNLNINLEVKVNVRGVRIAGVAERKYGVYRVRLNPLFCQQHPEDMMEDTIPHEVAHIVCFALKCCDGHGPNWKRIAKSLGCSAQRTHSLSIIDPKKTYYYVVFENGEKCDIGATRYFNVMNGTKTYKHRKNGKIDKNCKFEIVKGSDINAEVKAIKEDAKDVAKKAVEIKAPAMETNGKVLPKPSKNSAQLYVESKGDFNLFASKLNGKTSQYIKDQFKRAAYHA